MRDRSPVLTVAKTSHKGVILDTTSRACIREVRDIPVKSVTECLIRRVTLPDIFEVYTVERNPTSVRSVVKTSHIGVILTITSRVCTRVRNHTTALTVVKTSQIGVILDNTARVSTRQSESTRTESSEKNKPTV